VLLLATQVTVRFLPPEKSRATVTITFHAADSAPSSAEAKVVDGRLRVSIPKTAQSLTVETPVHSPCVLDPPFEKPCELRSLTVFEPFARGQTGRLWFRKAGDEKAPWKTARRLSSEDGPGFALAEEAFDVLLAPENEAASMHLGVFPAQLAGARSVPDEVDPATIVARVALQDGSAFGGLLRVRVVESDGNAAAALRVRAWRSFYETHGSSFERGGLLRISPLPRESLLFSLEADGYSGVTLSSRGKARDRVINAGTITLRRPISLAVVLESSLAPEELPRSMTLDMVSVRGAAGFDTAGDPAAKTDVKVGERVEFKGLSPGVWNVLLKGDGALCGFKEVNLSQPSEVVMTVALAQVEGIARLRDGTAVVNAKVAVRSHESDEIRPVKTETDRDGHFVFRFVHAGGGVDVAVFRDSSDYGGGVEDVDPTSPEAQSLRITLRGGEVRIRVTNSQRQKPIPDARVVCNAPALHDTFAYKQTDAQGVASFGGLATAEWACWASAVGFAPKRTERFQNNEDAISEHRLDLSTARRLRGLVTGPSGPASGATVIGPFEPSPLDPESGFPPPVQSSADGSFEVEVPVGQSALLAFVAPGYRLDFVNVLPEDDELQLALTPRGPDSRIELVTEDGRPARGAHWTLSRNGWRIPGLVLHAYLPETGCMAPATDSEGSVLFGGCLGPGTYRFMLDDWKRRVDIPSEAVQFPAPPSVRLTVFTKKPLPRT
ncbi:MAG: hypothetical protein ACRD1P_10630, partial [Thermoanaerobaculia bacterium]